jgi:hypothetical protein
MPEISKRKLESYKRAEKVCRELRHLISNRGINELPEDSRLVDDLLSWMRVTGKIKYERPKTKE